MLLFDAEGMSMCGYCYMYASEESMARKQLARNRSPSNRVCFKFWRAVAKQYEDLWIWRGDGRKSMATAGLIFVARDEISLRVWPKILLFDRINHDDRFIIAVAEHVGISS